MRVIRGSLPTVSGTPSWSAFRTMVRNFQILNGLPRKPIRSPAFEFPRLDGDGDLTLASLRGKAVVLNFWASWCAPCKDEIPALQAAWQRHRRQGLVVVGVDIMDAAGDARSFARNSGITGSRMLVG